MAASYPSTPKSFTTKTDGPGQTIFASYVNDPQDEIVALETALLTGGLAHGVFPSSAGAQHLGTTSLPWGTLYARALDLDAATTLTIASGVVTVTTRSNHALDTESAAASDDLDTITATGPTDGFVLILRAANVARVVTLKDGTGNLLLNGDYALSATDRTITLVYDGSNWREIARSVTSGLITLLKANSGTSTAAGATNVDSVSLGTLTALDQIEVHFTISQATQQVARFDLYSTTDSTIVLPLSNTSTMGAGVTATGQALLMADQSAATVYNGCASVKYWNGAASGNFDYGLATTGLTAWTSSPTLALRHGGVQAGGTMRWKWVVYKRAGQ